MTPTTQAEPLVELTREEKLAIAALKRLARRWPKSLWLFSNGDLSVLKALPDGSKAHDRYGSIDQGYVVDHIPGIVSDGGDW